MAVKVYTPGQFYAAGGVVEEMFYQKLVEVIFGLYQ